jgi:hypothetical protein
VRISEIFELGWSKGGHEGGYDRKGHDGKDYGGKGYSGKGYGGKHHSDRGLLNVKIRIG